jgi:hypothetical protein
MDADGGLIAVHNKTDCELILQVRPSSTPGRYDGWVGDTQVAASEEEPLFAAARLLLANGVPGGVTVTVVWPSGTRGISGPIGKLARLRVKDDNGGRPTIRRSTAPESMASAALILEKKQPLLKAA